MPIFIINILKEIGICDSYKRNALFHKTFLLRITAGGRYKADTIDSDFSALTKKFDFGFTFGAGISYQLRTYTIFLESRCNLKNYFSQKTSNKPARFMG